jgi:hypothetical protein
MLPLALSGSGIIGFAMSFIPTVVELVDLFIVAEAMQKTINKKPIQTSQGINGDQTTPKKYFFSMLLFCLEHCFQQEAHPRLGVSPVRPILLVILP